MITLATLPNASAQEVFDQAARHLLTQNAKAENEGGGCVYHMEDGRMCAAGCFISKEEYLDITSRGQVEERGWSMLMVDNLVPKEHADLITDFQEIHDGCSVNDWPHYLRNLAEEQKLNTNVLDLPLVAAA